jgi:hypothetical protein
VRLLATCLFVLTSGTAAFAVECRTWENCAGTMICDRPLFRILQRLKQSHDGSAEKGQEITATLGYVHMTYCRTTDEEVTANDSTALGDCTQFTGMHRGQRVYWEVCTP